MKKQFNYPPVPDFGGPVSEITSYMQCKYEYGAKGIEPLLARADKALRQAVAAIKRLPVDGHLAARRPNELDAIRSLRPKGPRRIWETVDAKQFLPRLEGAILGRCAGCTLGAGVEGWPVDKMKKLARYNGDAFPPKAYWSDFPAPWEVHYRVSPRTKFTRSGMNGVPADDDIGFMLLGLLILEEHGIDFTTDDVGKSWLKYVTIAWTAEERALNNLKAGVPALQAGEVNNPYTEWIGADIRSDAWGYVSPGWPERAAQLAYRDAYLSHRREGIYGAMFFSAAIAAAFTVKHPLEAIEIGLTEIPRECWTADSVRWALKKADSVRDHEHARVLVDERFPGLSVAHTVNNACITVFGLALGGTDFTRVIGQTVAMGLDSDCTTATAGSIAGAVVGRKGIARHWHAKFNDRIYSYLTGARLFKISDVVKRFASLATEMAAKP